MIISPDFAVLCCQVMDVLLVPCYLVLSLAALATNIVPSDHIFRELARHGKTLLRVHSSNNSTPVDGMNLMKQWMVDKRYFSHFYIFGIISACVVAMVFHTFVRQAEILNGLAFGLLILHMIRRLVECLYVHKWEGSKMHVAGYLVGLFHYLILPFTFISLPDCNSVETSDEILTQRQPLMSQPQVIIGIILCLFAQTQQHRHHMILAEIRQRGNEEKKLEPGSAARKSVQKYHIPRGGLFHYVSCPHYFAEILIYASFLLLLRDIGSASLLLLPAEWNCGPSLSLCESWWQALNSLKGWKAEALLLWVTTNLSVSAWNSHSWYLSTFQGSYPQNRKALIPFVW
mmetsp:Transcript_24985/g.38643  ORF Transcript_24985/g.38643 Transcript_24985/m.38643 type:complete len:344 (-) Transcript_24985:60-1091(-)